MYICGKRCAHPFVYLIHTLFREMFHSQRWLQDTRFCSPMAETSVRNIFLYDFVTFNFGPHLKFGRILQFLFKVLSINYILNCTLYYPYICLCGSMQEGESGLLARIQCVERDGSDVYVMGDDVSVPTENITALTRPPLYIHDKNSLSLLAKRSE